MTRRGCCAPPTPMRPVPCARWTGPVRGGPPTGRSWCRVSTSGPWRRVGRPPARPVFRPRGTPTARPRSSVRRRTAPGCVAGSGRMIGALAVFALAMGVVTGTELVTGQTPSGARGTTLSNLTHTGGSDRQQQPRPRGRPAPATPRTTAGGTGAASPVRTRASQETPAPARERTVAPRRRTRTRPTAARRRRTPARPRPRTRHRAARRATTPPVRVTVRPTAGARVTARTGSSPVHRTPTPAPPPETRRTVRVRRTVRMRRTRNGCGPVPTTGRRAAAVVVSPPGRVADRRWRTGVPGPAVRAPR